MRILLSTIGSRGDVQPIVALAWQLKALGHTPRLCVPPDFRDWIETLGLEVVPLGPELRATGKANPAVRPSPEQIQQMREDTVDTQFETLRRAARDCELMLGATALQLAAPSVAEELGVPYVFAAFCPIVLPSRHHAPPVLAMLGDRPAAPSDDYRPLWEQDAARWNMMWRDMIDIRRAEAGLAPIADMRSYVHTARPWLAADAVLAPWPEPEGVFQTGAWILPDDRPLSAELEAFLADGEPPVYFGFGSISAPAGLAEAMIASARALGRRAILLRGWAELELPDGADDCLTIGEVNQQALFQRVAAVVHHGGAGTTTAAARAGAPQVVIAQHYDQHYFAQRVQQLGIGAAHAGLSPTADALTACLGQALGAAERAHVIAGRIRSDGARIAAEALLKLAA